MVGSVANGGDRCFAVAVHAGSPETEVDWRCRYDEVCTTPDVVRHGVVAYLRAFSLTFGAFDFSVTPLQTPREAETASAALARL